MQWNELVAALLGRKYSLMRSRYENASPNLCWVFCALLGVLCNLIREVFSRLHLRRRVVDTHLPRFEALAYVFPHFDALTHLVIRVSSAFIFQTFVEVCYSVFVNRSSFKSVLKFHKAYIFKSFLKVYCRSVLNESFKAFIFQTCAESLHPE